LYLTKNHHYLNLVIPFKRASPIFSKFLTSDCLRLILENKPVTVVAPPGERVSHTEVGQETCPPDFECAHAMLTLAVLAPPRPLDC